ncbi:MAG: beta-propeller domain-containing protein [Deltaproteobacteria bacterium]|nr:beta-propeller domain-containing protein [Deltaproteobacteria bacterium]
MHTNRSNTSQQIQTLATCLAVLLAASCADSSRGTLDVAPPNETPAEERVIEESDLYKLVGDWLYVQNPTSGLNIISVANPDDPFVQEQLPDVRGEAGELYVRDDRVYVLFRGTVGRCTLPPEMEATWAEAPERSEVVIATGAPLDAKVAGRYCLPGDLVASRIVGDILYMVTTSENYTSYPYTSKTWLISLNVSDPQELGMVDFRFLTGDSREIHVTQDAIFLTQAMGGNTLVQYIDISDPEGVMIERGDLMVSGDPAGRFHMDAFEDTFRIVTFSGVWSGGTNLHVIDISDPDYLWLMSSYTGLAPGEELWATRFVEEKAYIVTYLRDDPMPRDPLWVIDLSDPYTPLLLGELEIPGWSNFLYPRGDQIVAVGRGDRGARVAVSLFDVSDPTSPAELRRLEFGSEDATSEANLDFRGVRIIEDETFGHIPLITVPYTNNDWNGSTCTPEHHLQLIDLEDRNLKMRGEWTPSESQQGLIRRTVPIGGNVYIVSDRVVAAIDVSNRDNPWPRVSLTVAGAGFEDVCTSNDFTIPPDMDDNVFSFFPLGCNMSGPVPIQNSPLPWLLGALLLLFVLRLRRAR